MTKHFRTASSASLDVMKASKDEVAGEWQPIATAPRDRDVHLKAWIVPSEEAQRNGSKPHWCYGFGRWLWEDKDYAHGYWSCIWGGHPTHWREDD